MAIFFSNDSTLDVRRNEYSIDTSIFVLTRVDLHVTSILNVLVQSFFRCSGREHESKNGKMSGFCSCVCVGRGLGGVMGVDGG